MGNCWVVPQFHSGNKINCRRQQRAFSPLCAIVSRQPSATADACQQSCFCTNLLLSSTSVLCAMPPSYLRRDGFYIIWLRKETWQDPECHTSRRDCHVRWRPTRTAEQNTTASFPTQPYIHILTILTSNAYDRYKPHI